MRQFCEAPAHDAAETPRSARDQRRVFAHELRNQPSERPILDAGIVEQQLLLMAGPDDGEREQCAVAAVACRKLVLVVFVHEEFGERAKEILSRLK